MKLSMYAWVTDFISVRKTFFERAADLFLHGETQKMYRTESIKEIIKVLKNAGVEGIELLIPGLTSDKNIEEVKKIMQTNSMPVLSVHQSLNNFRNIQLEEIIRLCTIANIFTANIVVLHIGSIDNRLFDNDFVDKLKLLQKKYHVTFGIENLPKTFWSLSKTYFFKTKEFSSVINKAGFFITFDTTHLAQVGDNINEFYVNNKDKIINIHLSDYKRHLLNKRLLLHNYTHLPLGKGDLPMREFLTLLKRTHYNGLITMEIDASLKDICESARMIKKYLR